MKKSKIIILIREGEDFSSYLGYIKEMQLLFKKEILFLILREKKISDFLETHFMASALAEEGAQELALEELKNFSPDTRNYIKELINQLKLASLENYEILIVTEDLFKEVKGLLEKEFRVELFIISPKTNEKFFSKPKGLKKLVEEFTVPFITLIPKTS
ncbi:hypothetical protein THC_0371 [Caldimicrobium thiodismutans]|jgi:hypothetical protein|uniref:UspA domain-containing protein n=1 Tax=Caldimicrobium thiodismutans TaxID=1653476 RepID=A0A0U5APJ7_9BACT|nr:hypothetical protein [Caldimicrobium thiodismutans]BAU22769.1 hypothetical protein THC_0371 [Caldimicrobium thiodismutans]